MIAVGSDVVVMVKVPCPAAVRAAAAITNPSVASRLIVRLLPFPSTASGAKRISLLAASNSLKAPPSRPVRRNAVGPMPNKPAGWQPQSDVVATPEAISIAVTEPL